MSRVSRPCGPNAPVGVWATPQVLAPALGAAAGEEQAAFLGELLEARPAPTPSCVFTFAARTLKRHRSIPGPRYRCGKSTFKSSLWATPGGKAPETRVRFQTPPCDSRRPAWAARRWAATVHSQGVYSSVSNIAASIAGYVLPTDRKMYIYAFWTIGWSAELTAVASTMVRNTTCLVLLVSFCDMKVICDMGWVLAV